MTRSMALSSCDAAAARRIIVADHLGWIKEFDGQKGVTVEDLVKQPEEQGQSVTRIDLGDVLNFIAKESPEATAEAQAPSAESANASLPPSKE